MTTTTLDDAAYATALGDRRERAVSCFDCRTDTWRIDGRCDRCAARRVLAERDRAALRAKLVRHAVDRHLVAAACDVDPHPDRLHAALLDRLDTATGRLAKRTAAALYATSLHRNECDALATAVSDVQGVQGDIDDRTQQYHEPERCFTGPEDDCTVCVTIRQDRLADALDDLRALLGDRVLADLAAAVA